MSEAAKLTETDHRQGNKNARVILLEYGDYECPRCGAAYPIIKKLQRLFDTELLYAFRNFPLSEIHPYALEAAFAAEAAGRQGKFWTMHDLIFENQLTLSSRQLLNLSRVIGADIEQLVNDKKSEEVRDRVENDMAGGVINGVSSTPTFFINGVRFGGYHDFESLKQALHAYLL